MSYELLEPQQVRDRLTIKLKRFSSGEHRFQLRHRSGAGCSITEVEHGGWQRAHSHIAVAETMVVHSGWCAVATINGAGSLRIEHYRAGDIFTVKPRVKHCVYVPAGCIVITVKHGAQADLSRDWVPAPNLDELCADLTEEYLRDNAP